MICYTARFVILCNWVYIRAHISQGKPGKLEENIEKLKSQGKPGKLREICYTARFVILCNWVYIRVHITQGKPGKLEENLEKLKSTLLNFLIL